MKNKEFYHSKVTVIDYPFNWINMDIDTNYKDIIQKFNCTKDINIKTELSKYLPDNIFPVCRFCNKKIINSNFILSINKQQNAIKLSLPNVYCREIDGKKYYLSCCEQCLLEHFKNNPPKAPKYYFMKANKYGQYCFGYSDEEYHKICSMTVGVTYDSMLRKWGKELGEQKWKEYCKKQAKINSYEYKKEKYGWTKVEFDEFNKKRAVTKTNLINKYGEDLGLKYFNDYVNKQKITKSLEYMIDKYGKEKANEINKSKAITLENFIKKYGENNGLKKYEETINKHYVFYSKLSQKFFNDLDEILSKKYTTYYATKNQEYGVMLSNNIYVKLDYFIKELNLCIEFNGDCFHANPQKYKADDTPNPFKNDLTSKQIWENDNNRYKLLKEVRNIDTVVVWESDYYKGINVEDFIKNILKITI